MGSKIILSACSIFLAIVACSAAVTPAPVTVVPRTTPTCTPEPSSQLTIFAAESLTASFTVIGRAFESAYPGTTVTFEFAGPYQLADQILFGARADLYACDSTRRMQALIDEGHTTSSTQTVFARAQLTLIVPVSNPAGIKTLHDLANPGVKIVIPRRSIPAGDYVLEMLDHVSHDPGFTQDFTSSVIRNVVSYEDTSSAVVAKVLRGKADAGIVYATDIAPEIKDHLGSIAIPDDLNVTVSFPIAIIADSPDLKLAQTFRDFLLSAEGQAVLAQYGFLPPK